VESKYTNKFHSKYSRMKTTTTTTKPYPTKWGWRI